MKRFFLLACISSTLLTGCLGMGQSDFSCKGVPEGVSCVSARDVYQATEYAEYLGPNNKSTDGKLVFNPSPVAANDPAIKALQQMSHSGSIPIRMPEQVQRTWVAPWEDEDGNLHMASLIYTEIEKRRWVVGAKATNPAARISPLDVRSRSENRNQNRDSSNLSNFSINLPKGAPNNAEN